MPPIPKFAKTLAKLSKANPKVIPAGLPSKMRKSSTLEKAIEKQIEVKKFANDDAKFPKIIKEKMRKELKQNFADKLSDNLDLMSLTKELKSVRTDDLKGNADKISEYIKKFKNFLDIVIASLKPDDSAIDTFNELSGALDKIDATKVESIPTSIRKIASKIHKKARKGVDKYGEMV